MKEKLVDIVYWKYLKEKDGYILTFRINGLKQAKREVILKKHNAGILNAQGAEIEEIIEVGKDLYVKEYYNTEYFEIYKSLISLAQKSVIPKRLDPGKLEIEVEMCMIEQEMEYRMQHIAETVDEFKKNQK